MPKPREHRSTRARTASAEQVGASEDRIARYGKFYWCVKVAKTLAKDGEIYVHADSVETTPDGAVVFVRRRDDGNQPNLMIAAGQWYAVYAAAVMDGSATAVEHWTGEVIRA